MKQRKLKSGVIRHYCERCGARINDQQLVPTGIFVLGTEVWETKIVARYKAAVMGGVRIGKNRYDELCADCVNELRNKKEE